MSEKIHSIKKHFRDNKKLYIVAGATAAVSVAATVIIMKCQTVSIEHADLVQNINQRAIGIGNNLTVVNFIENSTASKPVHLEGTNQYFASLSEAARETGHALSRISKNVNGHIPDVNGDVFTLLDKVA